MEKEQKQKFIEDIMNEYHNEDICMYELLLDRCALPQYMTIVDAVEIFAECMKRADGDYLKRGNVSEGWSEYFAE